jgi:hypothetical protein
VFGLVAETSGHAAARALDQFRLGIRDEPQHIESSFHGAERLLVAMSVQQQRGAGRIELELEASRLHLASHELLEQHRVG